MGISVPTEIQCLGIPNVLQGKSVVLGSHTGSGKTLAYLLPLVQLLRQDEALNGLVMKPRRPCAVVLCPTRELCEQAVQKLVNDEFQGIEHLRTSTLRKKVASACHDFIKLSGAENKLEALLQVLEPSLAKGNRVMVFCNTLNSSHVFDHFLGENQLATVNYHGEVPAVERVENLKKFKSDDGDCPTLVCTDLAAQGLDLDVDRVIMFDFPLNSIDYLHRTGRTARMGAKGKVTSLITKKDLTLANLVEEAMRKNESRESLSLVDYQRNGSRPELQDHKGKGKKPTKVADQKNNKTYSDAKSPSKRSPSVPKASKAAPYSKSPTKSSSGAKSSKVASFSKSKKSTGSFSTKPFSKTNSSKKPIVKVGTKTRTVSQNSSGPKSTLKPNVVGFRGRSVSSASIRAG